jgi:hypothetical protein
MSQGEGQVRGKAGSRTACTAAALAHLKFENMFI